MINLIKKFNKKIIFFFKESYHRPSAKILHFVALINSLRFTKKSKNFSEKILLLKIPPLSTTYYNFFGRVLFLLINYISVIFLGKFLEKDLYIKNFSNYEDYKKEINSRPWPVQSILYKEKKNLEEINETFYESLKNNYLQSKEELDKNDFFNDSEWWKDCRKEFNNIFIKDNQIDKENLKNFRNNVQTKAEILADQNFINEENSSLVNKLRTLSLVNLYHKISEYIDLNILRFSSESEVGNNFCPTYRSQRLSYRILRYAYYLSQITKHTNFKEEEKLLILDIGGGYGGLSRVLKHYYSKSTNVIIELPELCLLGSYFLKKCFPKKKFGFFDDFKNLEKINYKDIEEYDFVFLTPPFIEKFEKNIFDLAINTTSLGEMTDDMQEYYVSNIERITKEYFYSVNRPKKRVEKYNSKGFYDFEFKEVWRTKIYNYTHTYHIEFLGKKEKK